ncbi:uncharacterized protein LOC117579703 isoform X2 [Drosophila guanche]|nr:uncharacterized protein LOC117579703 isoform X2 [Drosophila guanche]SPP75212.1 Hypothetical predicted protein [Drosophila guanche]
MHSSQQPAERLPLTKGRTVDGLVKRLSMERFSPQPYISQPGFSYIRPNEGITYAQLDHSPLEESRQRSPLGRDMRSPQREFAPARPPRANDRAQHSPGQSSYSPTANGGAAPLPTRVSHSHSHSPSPWQQLSPRNLSDEDEGLGYEPRKVYYEDEYPPRRPEPPIVPVIRSVSPAPYLDELGYRRAQLETRILTRRFGEGAATLERHNRVEQQPERERDRGRVYLSPERDEERFQRVAARPTELSNEYPAQQERSQVDGTLPKMEKTSRYRHTKYYDDGHGGVKETYVRETQKDGQIRESRHRERIGERERDYNSADRLEHEPKSLDSQLTGTDLYRSSPELRPNQHQQQQQSGVQQQDYWQSSLKRDKLQQRSFDKGDSGIENDFRKESFNGDLTTRWRKRTAIDDMRACESFLRKERRDSAQQRQLQRQAIIPARLRRENSYVYRERSIDDGSHFDPHLDKYPVATSTLRRREQQSQSRSQSQPQSQSREDSSTLKRNKKLGGFEKVKQLFTGAASGSHGGSGRSSGSNVSSGKKERLSNGQSNSSTLSRRDKEKQKERERYMVREEEMRSRYREHQALAEENSREPKTIDISMRRRLSTPKASPLLLKRSSADKPPKKLPQKAKEATPVKVEKTSWFKSLDRRAKSSPKELNVSVNGHSENTSSLKRSKRNATAAPAKNLRFFGDTDLDSNPPTISKASSMPRSRPSLGQSKHSQSAYNLDRSPPPPSRDYRHTLSGQSQGSQSAVSSRQRASSMQHLDNGSDEVDFRKRRHYSRSRELHDISESGSEPEPAERHKRSSTQRAMSLERSAAEGQRVQRFEDRPLMGPPKPARSAERRGLLSSLGQENVGYGRDRFPAESSGTEGESSLHSQRSVVYLHATTVGDIPQPYNLRRRSVSREDLRKGGASKQQQQQPPPPLQPMTRTVSRSVSMLAPWKPKHISEGYEINYSQEQNKRMSTLPRKPPPHNGATSASTLSRLGRKNETSTSTLTPSRRHHMDSLDRPPPPRSVLSASNLRSAKTK